jgi:hypothetical protein
MGSGAAEYWSSGTPRGTISYTPRGGRGEEEGRAWTPCVSDVFGGIPMGGRPNEGAISVVFSSRELAWWSGTLATRNRCEGLGPCSRGL